MDNLFNRKYIIQGFIYRDRLNPIGHPVLYPGSERQILPIRRE
jgi:hypothetical protein